ncbi:MAG: phosphomethylpyrimidine kinase [Myxococcaceae bacterium]|nr:phosphomethylpyrimidine kinase [Myxococcaceae bacterium]
MGHLAVTALVIAGSDSSGRAGIQADLRALDALGVHGLSVVTLVTARGRRAVKKVDALRSELVRAQLAAATDTQPRAVKVGALGNAAVVEIVADALRGIGDVPVVLDPVITPMQGRALLDDSGYAALVRELLPLAGLLVPNREEAARLIGRSVGTPRQVKAACQSLVGMGARAVLLKGGHFDGPDCIDTLYDGNEFIELRVTRRALPPMLGLGCTLSALVTAELALGRSLVDAVRSAHAVVQHAVAAPRLLADGVSTLGDLRNAVASQRRGASDEGSAPPSPAPG